MTTERIMAGVLVVLGLAGPAAAADGRPWRHHATADELRWTTITHDGVERRLGWYAGVSAGSGPVPLVLVLHGGGGSADRVWTQDLGRAWRRLADDHGLVLLLPEGRADPGDPGAHHWNDCRDDVIEPVAASAADDVGFLRASVRWAAERWEVDEDRVYVTGASNGGMMSYRLAIEAHELVAAAAGLIANLPRPSECRGPYRATPMLVMNGTEDPLMPWEGGCIGRSGCDRGSVASTAATVSFWVDVDRAEVVPSCRPLADTDPDDGSTVTVCTHAGGVAGSEVVLYRIDGGGHAPPGPEPLSPLYELVVGPKNHDISAADEIWDFFRRHRRSTPGPRRPGGRLE